MARLTSEPKSIMATFRRIQLHQVNGQIKPLSSGLSSGRNMSAHFGDQKSRMERWKPRSTYCCAATPPLASRKMVRKVFMA